MYENDLFLRTKHLNIIGSFQPLILGIPLQPTVRFARVASESCYGVLLAWEFVHHQSGDKLSVGNIPASQPRH